MSHIYENFLRNIKKYPKKIFIYTLEKQFSGSDCYYHLKKTEKFIKSNNIKSIGIKSENSFEWIILYLAADKFCNQTFIIRNNTNSRILKKIKKKYKIDFIASELPQEKSKVLKIKNMLKKKIRQDVLFTSGTTDISKGVIIEKNSFIHVAKVLIKNLNKINMI